MHMIGKSEVIAMVNELREHGLRVTIARTLVWRILTETHQHFTVETLWQRVREEIPHMEISTVYRILDAFLQAGLIVYTTLPEGIKLVEAQMTFHPHFLCRQCGNLYHVPSEAAQQLQAIFESALPEFLLKDLQVLGRGICPRCLERCFIDSAPDG